MKKILLILFMVSFIVGSIWTESQLESVRYPKKNSTNMRIDSSDIRQLPEKPDLNRTYDWYEYAVIAEGTHLNWPIPERATFFEMYDFCIEYPATIEQVSHVFYEHASYPWPDATFHFKIYDADGTTLLHESGDLEAAHYVEYFYTLPTPLVVTNDFYVAVVPIDASGHPSSMSTDLHVGHSYTGSAGAWTFYPDHEFITGVYLEGIPSGPRLVVTPPDPYDFGGVGIGVPDTVLFVLSNFCLGEIIINPAPTLTGDPEFTIISDNGAPYPTTIPTDQTTVEIEVQFIPTALGAFSTILTIVDNLTENITNINITGTGILEPDCTWEIWLYDTYGDGWNGGTLDVLANGNTMLDDITIPSGSGPDVFTFGIFDGGTVSTVFTAGGWPEENWYEIYDNVGTLIITSGPVGGGPPDVLIDPAVCATPPTCLVPTDLFTDVIFHNSANLNWTAGATEPNWNIEFGPAGFTPTGIPTYANIGNPFPVSGLTASTSYDWYVQADCDGTGFSVDESNWVGATFTTLCDPITVLPALEDFELFTVASNATGYTNCWSTSPENTTSFFRWNVDDGGTPSGTTGPLVDHTSGTSTGNYLFTESSSGSTGDIAYVYSPLYDLSSLTNPQVDFWYHMCGAEMGELHLDIDAGTGWVNDIMTALVGQQQTAQGDDWLPAIVSLSAYSGQTVKFRFRGIRGDGFRGDMAMDDVTVKEAPPYGVSVTPASTSQNGWFGNQVTYTVNIANIGTTDDNYDLTVSGYTWTTVWNDGIVTIINTGNIPAGTNVDFYVVIDIPASPATNPDVVDIIVTSVGDPAVTETKTLTTTGYATSGGPDTYGYTWTNNFDAAGPTYGWITPTHNPPLAPANVLISIGTDVIITWDPVFGATTYKVESSTDPYGVTPPFAEDLTGVFVGEQWTAPDPGVNTFYRVIADGPGNNIQPLLADDNVVGPIPIGFNFNFYGTDYTEFSVSSNGFIGFGTQTSSSLSNYAIPSTSGPENIIAWFWDDMDPGDNPNGDTYVYYENLPGTNDFLISFIHYHEYAGGGTGELTAQIILHTNGDITLQYNEFVGGIDMDGNTVGIENAAGDDGLQYQYNEEKLVNQMAIKFDHPATDEGVTLKRPSIGIRVAPHEISRDVNVKKDK